MEGERLHIIIKKEIIKDEIHKKQINKKIKSDYISYVIYLENRYTKIPVAIVVESNYSISDYTNLYLLPYKTKYGKKLSITLKKNIIKQFLKHKKGNYAIHSTCNSMNNMLCDLGFRHSGTIYDNLYYISL